MPTNFALGAHPPKTLLTQILKLHTLIKTQNNRIKFVSQKTR